MYRDFEYVSILLISFQNTRNTWQKRWEGKDKKDKKDKTGVYVL